MFSQTTSQVQSVMSTIKTVKQPTFSFSLEEPPVSTDGDIAMQDETSTAHGPNELSEAAVLTALFGWSILPQSERPQRVPSVSRGNSFAPSVSVPQTPVRLVRSISRESTPSPSPSRLRSLFGRSQVASSASAMRSPGRTESTLLHCALCQRRIGLWAFQTSAQVEDLPTPTPSPQPPQTPTKSAKTQPRRQLDILKEHRSYCPYVVRSTEIPSMPLAALHQPPRSDSPTSQTSSNVSSLGQSGAVEGWRAVLTIVLRYGAAQRQRFGLGRTPSARRTETSSGTSEQPEDMPAEMNEVEAMVAGVKSHGVRGVAMITVQKYHN